MASKDENDKAEEAATRSGEQAAAEAVAATEAAVEAGTVPGEVLDQEVVDLTARHRNASNALTDKELSKAKKEHGEFFIDFWSGRPLFGCPFCQFSTIESNDAVEFHIDTRVQSGDPKHWLGRVQQEGAK